MNTAKQWTNKGSTRTNNINVGGSGRKEVLAIAQRIPVELLCDIFLESVSMQEAILGRYAVFALAAVCKRWRDIAVECPRLWNKLLYKTSLGGKQKRQITKLKTLIQRSKMAPLQLTIDAVARTPAEMVSLSEAFAVLVEVSDRWQMISLAGAEEGCIIAMSFLQQPLPIMKHMQLVCFTYQPRFRWNPKGFLPALPNLESLTIRDLPLPSCPLPRLTELDFITVTQTYRARELSDFLQRCPAMTWFQTFVAPGSVSSYNDASITPFTLPCMESVHLNNAEFANWLMSTPSLPQLRRVALNGAESPLLMSLISHPDAIQKLTCLVVDGSLIPTNVVSPLLPSLLILLPNLGELHFVEGVPKSVLSYLSWSPWPCPKLRSLNLKRCSEVDWEELYTFVQSRVQKNLPSGVMPLQEVVAHKCGITEKKLRALRFLLATM